MNYSGLTLDNDYQISETEYSLENEAKAASLLTTGNGYLGVRGSIEEYGSLCVQGAYIRGIIDEVYELPTPLLDNEYMKKHYFNEPELRRFQKQEKVVNFADFLLVRIRINGEIFFPWEGRLLFWNRTLDIANGRLVRNVRWENNKGEITTLAFTRFASFENDHIYAIKVDIIPENYTGQVEILTGIDGMTKTNGQLIAERIDAHTEDKFTYYTNKSGNKYGFVIATAVKNELYVSGKSQTIDWKDASDSEIVAVKCCFTARERKTYSLEKTIYITTSRDVDNPSETAETEIKKTANFNDLYFAHRASWKDFFEKSDVIIEGDDIANRALRFNNYHTAISICRHDHIHSLGAKGLTGEVYGNWIWWDCEAYQAPFFNYSQPNYAKNLIMYRYSKLDAARNNAKTEGKHGARYPFNSSVTGDETVWKYVKHPFLQIHVVSDIGLNICHYYEATQDDRLMIDYGMEILYEICRYWIDTVTWRNNRYEILNVTGTDEHHPDVDNNAYTNYSVKEVFEKTIYYSKKFGSLLDNVKRKIGFEETEENKLKEIADKLYLPIDNISGLIPQFDGYFNLSRDLEISGGSSAKEFQMKSSGMYHKSQVIKQPDVLMIFACLNHKFDQKIYKRNWNYYLARCESSSSLSYPIHAICSADLDMMESTYQFFIKNILIDLLDEHNCTVQGIHSACAAGAWLAAVRGIGGVELQEDGVHLHPHMIGWWESLRFSFYWHSQFIKVVLTNEEISISSDHNNSKDIVLFFNNEKHILSAGSDLTIKGLLSIIRM